MNQEILLIMLLVTAICQKVIRLSRPIDLVYYKHGVSMFGPEQKVRSTQLSKEELLLQLLTKGSLLTKSGNSMLAEVFPAM